MTQLRGLYTFQDVLHVVRGDLFYRVDSNGTATELGTINSNGGPIVWAENLFQLQFTDGSFLYVWDGVTLATSVDWVPGDVIGVVDQRTVSIQRASQRFGWSALGDALSFAALDFASAESMPDILTSAVISNGDVWLGGKFSTEVWASVGSGAVFEKYRGSSIRYGVAGAYTMLQVGRTPMWLSQTKEGATCVVRGVGQQAEAVSNRAIDEKLRGLDLTYATAFVDTDDRSEYYCLNVPGVDTTLVYDSTYGQWHERADQVLGKYRQWRPRNHAFAYGKHWYGTNAGDLLYADPDVSNNDGDPLVRSRVCPVIGRQDGSYMRFGRAEVVCERGTNSTAMLRFKDDPQGAWSNWKFANTGATGRYTDSIDFERLGVAKGLNGRVYELRFTDDAPFNPVTVDFTQT
jgi:hypothetical protein